SNLHLHFVGFAHEATAQTAKAKIKIFFIPVKFFKSRLNLSVGPQSYKIFLLQRLYFCRKTIPLQPRK
ncbi:MAG: hypothetical protein J6C92_00545, partial [Bacteroidaceae bacterium]|nr:hypothetical protein [Bacteroidaceae bacterium]